jgi:hypothetical protein
LIASCSRMRSWVSSGRSRAIIKVRRRLVGDLQPTVSEGMLLVDRRVDAAAIDVAEHDDVRYAERARPRTAAPR